MHHAADHKITGVVADKAPSDYLTRFHYDTILHHGPALRYLRDLVGDDPGPNNFVLYSSRDGIHWDEGIVLMSRLQTPGGGDCYSANEVIGKYDPATPERLLIHSDVSYAGSKTNMHQWWVTTTPWADEAGGGATRSELKGQD